MYMHLCMIYLILEYYTQSNSTSMFKDLQPFSLNLSMNIKQSLVPVCNYIAISYLATYSYSYNYYIILQCIIVILLNYN